MWGPGQIITIKERIPVDGSFLELSTKMRVITNWGAHRCINCPMQQKYCDISKCESMLPLTCTLKKLNPQQDSEECES